MPTIMEACHKTAITSSINVTINRQHFTTNHSVRERMIILNIINVFLAQKQRQQRFITVYQSIFDRKKRRNYINVNLDNLIL